MRRSLIGTVAQAARLPGRAAFGAAVLGVSAARVGVATARSSASMGWAVTRAAGTVAVGAGAVAAAAAAETALSTPALVRGVLQREPQAPASPPEPQPEPARRPAAEPDHGSMRASLVPEPVAHAAHEVRHGLATTAELLPELLDPWHGRRHRRVWSGPGCCHVELHSESVEADPGFSEELRRQLGRLDGVSWSSVSDVLGRVLVTFDDGRVRPEDVVDVVVALERARGHAEHPFDPTRPDHPADAEPIVAAAVQLGADLLSTAVAVYGRTVRLPRAPRATHAILALTEGQPAVRAQVERRLGPLGTELAFGLVRAVLHGLTQRPTSMVFDAGQRALRLRELRARRAIWRERQGELHRMAPAPESEEGWPPPGRRPVPLPDGPIEQYAGRIALGSLPFAGLTLALTRRPGKAAEALHSAVPRAARVGREVFATLVGHGMSQRGVVALDGSVWRRLDRIDTVVIDSAALGTDRGTVLQALSCSGNWTDARVWSTAAALLDPSAHPEPPGAASLRLTEHADLPSPSGARLHGLYEDNRQVGYVTVGPRLDPFADALLDAVREMDARLVMTEHAAATDLLGRADVVLDAPLEGAASLVDTVRDLQAQGHVVLVVSAADGPALAAADAGVGILRPGSAPAWGADLLCGPGLREAVDVLATAPVARSVSRRAVRFAAAGTTLSWLMNLAGPPRRRRPLRPRPVLSRLPAFDPPMAAVVSAIVTGVLAARRVQRRPEPQPTEHIPWHALEPEQVLRLTQRQASAMEAAPSTAPARPGPFPSLVRPVLRLARVISDELRDPLTPVLAVGATASAMLGSPTDALLVGAVMTGNALLSSVQRLRAESALGALLAEQAAPAHRETGGTGGSGGVADIPAEELRVGDVIRIDDGDVVPADARLLEARGLEVDESSLTGESLPVAKSVEATPAADLPDRRCLVHQGTTVVAGSGRAVVVAVGEATVAGRTVGAATGGTPSVGLQARLAELTRTTLPLSLLGGAAVSGLGLLRRQALRPAVASGVAVAVAAVPEGLPLVATVAQTAVARRLSRRQAVVRSAGVTEALGRIDTICFDKTGTLTQNRLELSGLFAPSGAPMEGPDADGVLVLARTATPRGSDLPHATDRAVDMAAAARGLRADGERIAELPFTASRGFSVGLVRDSNSADGLLAVKGAPEVVLERCVELDRAARDEVLETARQLARRGLRILAVAERGIQPDAVGAGLDDGDHLEEAARDLRLRGLIGLSDRLRPGAETAVRQLRAAGVRPVIVTGDHPDTAAAIAAELGLDAERVVTGRELSRLSEDRRAEVAARTSVFARVSPEQKVAVVRALRRSGAVLAVVGDGVNDAAAIRLADVGIGVGAVDSASARSVAHIVLADNDLGSVVDAVGEGRSMWHSVRDAVSILVGGNAGEIAFSMFGTALGGSSPVNTRQFLLVNLLTDAFPALAVAVTPPRSPASVTPQVADALSGHPFETVLREGPQAGFTAELRRAVLARAATTSVGASAAWLLGRFTGPGARAGTMGLAALVSTQLAQTALVGRRSPLVLLTAFASALILVGIVQNPLLSRLFGCVPLDPAAWLVVLATSVGATVGSVLAPRLVRRLQPAAGRVPLMLERARG